MNKIYLGDTNLNVLKLGSGDTVIYLGNEKIYPVGPIDYSTQYLTFVAEEDCTFTFSNGPMKYSLDSGNTWTNIAAGVATPTIASGTSIMWRATITPNDSNGVGRFSSTGAFHVEGNPMSVIFGDDFVEQTSLSGKTGGFRKMFSGCTGLTSAENLVLPATTLSNYCYASMFSGCNSLTTTPTLPATTLANYCYAWMFANCTSLVTAPELPATTLADSCYSLMFQNCTGLTKITSELPATTAPKYCYNQMFQGCTSITTAPTMSAATLSGENTHSCMFSGCTSLTNVASNSLPATVLVDSCYNGMFANCTSLTTAPELPAPTLVNYCYNGMFSNCSSLNRITCLATDISATNCTLFWVNNVSPTGTFTKAASMTSWTTGYKGIPSGWTVETA